MSIGLRTLVWIGTIALVAVFIPTAGAQTTKPAADTQPAASRPATRPALPIFRTEEAGGTERRVVRSATPDGARCRVEVEVVDQDGEAIEGARLVAIPEGEGSGPISNAQSKADGVVVMQVPVSEKPYVITASHDDYVPGRMTLTVKDASKPCRKEMTLSAGAKVRGRAMCSDNKPAAGWKISARPAWWSRMYYYAPKSYDIGEDGSFTLEHISPGEYALSIMIPVGDGGQRMSNLGNFKLPPTGGLLDVKVPQPSPSSLVAISGTVEFIGGTPEDALTINASSSTGGSAYAQIRPGQADFRLTSLSPGVYELRFGSGECDEKIVSGVKAPSKKLKVQIQYRGKPVIKALIVEAGTDKPVEQFYYRYRALETRGSYNQMSSDGWKEEKSSGGKLEIQPSGRNVYDIQVWAEGFAVATSAPIDTNAETVAPVRIEMKPGPAFTGRVVDEAGRPVSGANVIPLTCAGGVFGANLKQFSSAAGRIETQEDGQFTLTYLPAGKEALKLIHPDHAYAIVETEIKDNQGQPPFEIAMKTGGTVAGQVFDAQGKPAAQVALIVDNDTGAGGMSGAIRLAVITTDADGRYKAEHLPEELCSVSRQSGETTSGVSRLAVVPKDGQTRTVNLGGSPRITGRLLIDGKPLAGGKLLMGGPSASGNQGFVAYADTDENGAFTFLGVPPGRRHLYFAREIQQRREYAEVKRLEATAADLDLGTISLECATVSVKVVGADQAVAESLRASLQRETPGQFYGGLAINPQSKQDPTEPFVFDRVPPGAYEIQVYQSSFSSRSYPTIRHRIEVKPGQREVPVTMNLPAGTASLEGKIGDGFLLPTGSATSLVLWSPQLEVMAYVKAENKHYRIESLPAGEYRIMPAAFRNGPPLAEVTIKEGENKVLDLEAPACRAAVGPAAPVGSVGIRIISNEGFPLPEADVYLEGADGRLEPASSSDVAVTFYGLSGEYTLHVAYPGFKPATRKLTIPHGVAVGAGATPSMEIITLEPASR